MTARLSINDGIAEVILDWPKTRNALGPDDAAALAAAIGEASASEQTCVVVLRSSSGAFCAGGNLASLVELVEHDPDRIEDVIYRHYQGLFRAVDDCPVPVLAAVDGPAVGLGCDLALAGDLTFIGNAGWLAQGWSRIGLIPATGGVAYATRRGGPGVQWRMLAAARIDGAAAETLGLAIAAANALETALDMARTLAPIGRVRLSAMKELGRIDDLEAYRRTALAHQGKFIRSREFVELASARLGRAVASRV